MLRPWSPPVRDWQGRGYDVAAHFPEFPRGEGPGTDRPWGVGELQVDYRRTYDDFTRLTDLYRPAAIITFSRCRPGSHWRIEPACRRWRLPGEPDHGWPGVAEYVSDRREPGFPLGLPPTNDPPDTRYASTLPTHADRRRRDARDRRRSPRLRPAARRRLRLRRPLPQRLRRPARHVLPTPHARLPRRRPSTSAGTSGRCCDVRRGHAATALTPTRNRSMRPLSRSRTPPRRRS